MPYDILGIEWNYVQDLIKDNDSKIEVENFKKHPNRGQWNSQRPRKEEKILF